MELTKIQISNFRSIKRVEIKIEEIDKKRCLILLGKNEAGKSNILKAILAIFGKYSVSEKDQRKEKSGEEIDEKDFYIRAFFMPNQADFSEIHSAFLEKYKNTDLITFQSGIKLEDFIEEVFSEIFLEIVIISGQSPNLSMKDLEKEILFNKKITLSGNEFHESNDKQNAFTIKDLVNILFEIIKTKWNLLSLYQCEKWEHSERFILPQKVNIETFKNNPDSCVPLKKLFFLGGKTNILTDIDKAYKRDESLINLLDNISKESTQTFRGAWRDLGEIGFSLTKDGDSIYIHIQDELKFSMEDRSDGFKHFVAMLLAFSSDDKNESCKKILLIDEPDTHLYPTSAKSLRNELLKISEKHLVIYSTHSPYMIDDTAIHKEHRHIIVEKNNWITEISKFDRKPNYLEDELLLRAIGCSVFERIKNKNMLFEGYNDYCLFIKHRNEAIFESYGAIYLGGISDIQKIAPMIMLTGTKFCVISDSDLASKDQRKNFNNNFPDHKHCWFEYDECEKQYKTLEDFFKQEFVEKIMCEEQLNCRFDTKKSMLENIKDAIKTLYKSKEQREETIRNIKNKLVDKAEKEDLKGYAGFLKKLEEKMKAL